MPSSETTPKTTASNMQKIEKRKITNHDKPSDRSAGSPIQMATKEK